MHACALPILQDGQALALAALQHLASEASKPCRIALVPNPASGEGGGNSLSARTLGVAAAAALPRRRANIGSFLQALLGEHAGATSSPLMPSRLPVQRAACPLEIASPTWCRKDQLWCLCGRGDARSRGCAAGHGGRPQREGVAGGDGGRREGAGTGAGLQARLLPSTCRSLPAILTKPRTPWTPRSALSGGQDICKICRNRAAWPCCRSWWA